MPASWCERVGRDSSTRERRSGVEPSTSVPRWGVSRLASHDNAVTTSVLSQNVRDVRPNPRFAGSSNPTEHREPGTAKVEGLVGR